MNICLINICIRGITDLKIRFERIRNLYLIVYKMFWRSGGRSPPNRAIWVLAVAGYIVLCSWARHLTRTVPLPPPPPPSPPLPPRCINIGAMDLSIPSRREYKYFQSLPATETGDKRRPDGPLGLQTLPLHLLALYGSLSYFFFLFIRKEREAIPENSVYHRNQGTSFSHITAARASIKCGP